MTRMFRNLCTLAALCLCCTTMSATFAAAPIAGSTVPDTAATDFDGEAAPKDNLPSEWAAAAVQTARDVGILRKTEQFSWQAPITREDFCTLTNSTLNALGKWPNSNVTNGNPFDDTYSYAVRLFHQLGIVTGTAPRTFGAKEPITRADAACIVARTADFLALALPQAETALYEDEADIPAYAGQSVSAVSNAGFFHTVGNVFQPSAPLTAEEAITLLVNLYEKAAEAIAATHTYEDALYQLMPRDKNYMISPFSLKAAFALAANGAAGNTLQEMLDTFGYANLDLYNKAVCQTVQNGMANDRLTFETANSVWINRDNAPVSFLPSYTKAVADRFDASAETVSNADAVKRVNDWASEKTHGKIPVLIDSSDFQAMLVNAVYFKGAWMSPFQKEQTADSIFTDRDGNEHSVPFMIQTDYFAYSDVDGTQILKLPYQDNSCMMLILPGETTASPRALIDAAEFNSLRVTLKMPKFHIENTLDLTETVQLLGINQAFNSEIADFTPMFGPLSGWFEKVIQKTYINVDEEGTEAAAITQITMKAGSASPQQTKPIEFTLDRPFLFAILDGCGEMLFMGEYAFAA